MDNTELLAWFDAYEGPKDLYLNDQGLWRCFVGENVRVGGYVRGIEINWTAGDPVQAVRAVWERYQEIPHEARM